MLLINSMQQRKTVKYDHYSYNLLCSMNCRIKEMLTGSVISVGPVFGYVMDSFYKIHHSS